MSNRPTLFAFRKVAVAVMLAAAMPVAMAWTSKPVRMLVPAPAGGTMDVIARVLAEQLSADLGQPVVVDNKPGASGGIAINTLLAAPPDGQTILVTLTNVFTEVPHVMKVSFDPVKDVRPVAAVSKVTMVLVGSTGLPARDLPSLIRYVKANPGKLSFASPSAGTVGHYAGMIMNQKAGMDLQHVPFPGSPPGLTQVMGGQITVMYDNMVTSLPLIKAGKLRPYALAAKQRSPLLPQVPTSPSSAIRTSISATGVVSSYPPRCRQTSARRSRRRSTGRRRNPVCRNGSWHSAWSQRPRRAAGTQPGTAHGVRSQCRHREGIPHSAMTCAAPAASNPA